MSRAIWLQAIAALLTLSPLLFLPLATFLGNNDALFYTIILKLTAHHLALGDVLPHWLNEANGGIGSPVMLYYCPLSYDLTASLGAPLSGVDPIGWKRLLVGMFAAQWLGGITAYIWLLRHAAPRNALTVSLLFTLFPYKWIYIYLHINLTQLWALAWLPLLMMAAEDMMHGKRNASLWYALWVAVIALTHPRTLVAFGAVPALYALFFAEAHRGRVLLKLIGAHLLALGLAAFYVLPAALNLPLVRAELSNLGRFNYAGNLSHEDLLFNFHYAVIAVLIIGLVIRLPSLRHAAGKKILFWQIALIIVTILCLRISQPLWDALPLLQFLQFPVSRLHTVALIAGCVLAAYFLENYAKVERSMRLFYSPASIFIPVALLTVFTWYHIYTRVYGPTKVEWSYVEQVHALNLIIPPEYLTRWQPNEVSAESIATLSRLPLAQVSEGNGTVSAEWVGRRQIRLQAHITSDFARLTLRQLYLPEWDLAGYTLAPDAQGLVNFSLPRGDHALTLSLTPFIAERAGLYISLASGLLLAALFFAFNASNRLRRPSQTEKIGHDE